MKKHPEAERRVQRGRQPLQAGDTAGKPPDETGTRKRAVHVEEDALGTRQGLEARAEALREKGFGVIPPEQFRIDIEPPFFALWEQVKPYTMISLERAYVIYKAVEYVQTRGIRGAFVECGVWKGGASMLMALSLQALGGAPRHLYLYDTFSGMTAPGREDRVAWNGVPVRKKWEEDRRGEKQNFTHWAIPREEVLANFTRIDYPSSHLHTVEGDVRLTLQRRTPGRIALLRLDTDWYDSTRAELERLYPRLRRGGVLLIDDYGHFTGARKAVDEYFAGKPIFLHRDDYTGRSAVKG